MEEKFRPEAELSIAANDHFTEIMRRIESLEDASEDFMKKMTTGFVNTITRRFEKIEKGIEDLNDKIEGYKTQNVRMGKLISESHDKINQVERKRKQENEMESALRKLAGPEKIRVNRKLLEELK